jgi:hypothetical protein
VKNGGLQRQKHYGRLQSAKKAAQVKLLLRRSVSLKFDVFWFKIDGLRVKDNVVAIVLHESLLNNG